MPIAETFERVPFLRALSPADRELLAPYTESRILARGEALWSEGQPSGEFSFVVRGRMKMVKAAHNGRQTILEMGGPGDLLCANAVCGYLPYCCSGLCMEEGSEIVVLPRRDVLALVERSPMAARAFMREITGRGVNMCQRVEELAGIKVEQRIAMLLLKLADRAGVPLQKGGIRVPVPLSRQDIADLCGTTIETSIRVMSGLRKKGVVTNAARGFVVECRESLEQIVNQGPASRAS